VSAAIADLATKSSAGGVAPEEASKLLDTLVTRLQNLKRKVR